ncbi:MAG: hypothetical protein ACKOXB_15670 [Flavobacteriales bacterium]
MKKLFVCLSAITMYSSMNAQWNLTGSPTVTNTVVGIGTASEPVNASLHVQGNPVGSNNIFNADDIMVVEGNNALLKLYGNNVGGIDFSYGVSGERVRANLRYAYASNVLTFNNPSGEAFRIDGLGNFGIGSFPTGGIGADLHIKNSTPLTELLLESTGGQTIRFNRPSSGVSNWTLGRRESDNAFVLTDAATFNGYSDKFVFTSTGLGIGTTPLAGMKLHVDGGDFMLNGTFLPYGTNTRIILQSHNSSATNSPVQFEMLHQSNGGELANRRGYLTLKSDDGNVNLMASQKVIAYTAGTQRMLIDVNGNIGVGAPTPDARLHVREGILHLESGASGGGAMLSFGTGNTISQNAALGQYVVEYVSNRGLFFRTPAGSVGGERNVLLLNNNGCVGIGTDMNPMSYFANLDRYKLAVNGSVRAREVVVEINWADYVFAKDYKLKSLKEVEQYINENGTLPNVPSEKEIKDKEIGLGEQNRIQQEKIEELTLYLIQMNKKLEEQEKTNKEMQEQISKLMNK